MTLEEKIRKLLAQNAADAAARASSAASSASFAATNAADAANEASRAANAVATEDINMISDRLVGLRYEQVCEWLKNAGIELEEEGVAEVRELIENAGEDITIETLDDVFASLELELSEDEYKSVANSLQEAYPGFGRNREDTPPKQGSSEVPPVQVLYKGAKGGADQRGSQASLAAGSGPFEAEPPKQGSSKKAEKEELDKEKPGVTAGDRASKMPVPTATGAGDAKNFVTVTDPYGEVQKRSTMGNVYREDMETLFATGQNDLSEDFKAKAASLFEAAVVARVAEKTEEIENSLAEESAKIVAEIEEELTKNIDSYLNEVVERWLSENEVAVENILRTEIAESFMEGLRKLFVEHNIKVPDAELDVVADLQTSLVEAEKRAKEAEEKYETLCGEIDKLVQEQVFVRVSDGLADTEVEKFRGLIEDVTFEDEDSYAEKLNVIRQNFFKSTAPKSDKVLIQDDEVIEEDAKSSTEMDAYMEAISKKTTF